MKAMAALTTDPDGKVVIEYLSQNADRLMTQSCLRESDVQSRWDQGAACALAELVDITKTASEKMRG